MPILYNEGTLKNDQFAMQMFNIIQWVMNEKPAGKIDLESVKLSYSKVYGFLYPDTIDIPAHNPLPSGPW